MNPPVLIEVEKVRSIILEEIAAGKRCSSVPEAYAANRASARIISLLTVGRGEDRAGDFIRQIARLDHTQDEGYTAPDDPHDASDALDGLIAQVRELRG